MEEKDLPCRGKSRQSDDDSLREGRRKDERKKTPRSKLKLTHSGEMDPADQLSPVNGHASLGNQSRYHQREVPPRFQHHKHTQKHIPTKTNQAVTKKSTKDTTRWQSDHTPSIDHTHTRTNDGGWSTGLPAKGSGWRKNLTENPDEWGQDKKSSNSWESQADSGVEGWAGQENGSSNKLKSENDLWGFNGRNEGGWSSDQDEGSSRSQSPGGIVMVVKQTTPSKDNGSNTWESKPVGSNWKMHTLDTKPTDCSHENIPESGRGNQDRGSEWDDFDSHNDRETELANQRGSLNEGGVANKDSTHPLVGSNRASLSSSQESSNDSTNPKTPHSDLSGATTPTQEMPWHSGRTSVGSTSSLTEVNNSTQKVGGAKGTQQMRSTSPRKMNRFDPTQSQSSNSLTRGTSLILPRPRKSLAELEGGLESLHNAPSGWGELPSPKSNEMDKGTEFWGIPPDDMTRMTGAEQQPLINGWSGSRSPRTKVGDYPEEPAGWSSNGIAGKGGWTPGEEVPPTKSENMGYFNESGGLTPSSHESHGGSQESPSMYNDSAFPLKTHKWNSGSFSEPKDPSPQQTYGGQSQMIQNQLLVKNLVIRYQQLAKMQLGQMQSSGNIQSLQTSLSQQLNQAQMVRQQLLSQVNQSGTPTLHPLKVQLAQTNDIISQIKQHILQNQQMLGNDSSSFVASQMRVKGEMKQPGIGHSQSANAIMALADGMRDMSLPQRSQTNQQARGVSRLHRIISGSPNQEEMPDNSYGNIPSASSFSSSTASSPFSPPYGSSYHHSAGQSTNTTTMASPALGPKPVHQIQEFKPGVPWQPRKSDSPQQRPSQDQYYGSGVQRSMTGNSFVQQQNRPGSQRFTRSQSTDNSYYGNQAPPTHSRDHPWNSGESRPQNFQQRQWNGGQRPNRISLPSTPVGHSNNLPPTPDQGPMGWRQGRSTQPPSTLLPKQDYQYRPQFESNRNRSRGTPIDAHPSRSQWGSFSETPGSAEPLTSVWGSEVNSSDNQGTWPGRRNSHGWNQGSQGSVFAEAKDQYPATPTSGDSINKWTTFPNASSEPTFAEWQAGKKARLSSTSSHPSSPPLSPWLVIRSTSAQLNVQSLKDTCKGYGDVKTFIGSPGSDFVLVGYSCVEEAMHAKPRIDNLWSGHASTDFVPEGDLEMLCQQLTMSEPIPKTSPPSSFHPTLLSGGGNRSGVPVSKWEEPKKSFSYDRQTSKGSTPGSSSVWSDGGFLSGISSPWSSDFSGNIASPSIGYHSDDLPSRHSVTPDERSSAPNSSSLSTFLPNGLL